MLLCHIHFKIHIFPPKKKHDRQKRLSYAFKITALELPKLDRFSFFLCPPPPPPEPPQNLETQQRYNILNEIRDARPTRKHLRMRKPENAVVKKKSFLTHSPLPQHHKPTTPQMYKSTDNFYSFRVH